MADPLARMPPGFLQLAKLYAGRNAHLGATAALIIGQSALESAWWTSRLWREGRGAFGIQQARVLKNRRHQTGEPVDLGGVLHAGYLTLADCFKDWERLVRQHAADHPRLDIWERLDRVWAPPDPRYPSNVGYSGKIRAIIRDYDLERFNTDIPAPRADLRPTEPYVPPPDPRDGPWTSGGSDMPWWLTLVSFLLPKLLPKLGGIFKGIFGDLLGAAGKAELAVPGKGNGKAREEKAVDILSGGAKPEGVGDMLLRLLLALVVQFVNSKKGNEGLATLAQATDTDGVAMADRLLT